MVYLPFMAYYSLFAGYCFGHILQQATRYFSLTSFGLPGKCCLLTTFAHSIVAASFIAVGHVLLLLTHYFFHSLIFGCMPPAFF